MKRIISCMALLCVAFTGAASQQTSQPRSQGSRPFKIGLVTDVGGIEDRSFNQMTWEGIVRFGEEHRLAAGDDYRYLRSDQHEDYAPNLASFADAKFDLIVAPGFLLETAIGEVADRYVRQKFLIIDSVVEKPNVASVVFAEHEGSFLVGVAAGLKARADGRKAVGFIGGMRFPLIEKFQAGFEQGVKAAYPECKVLVDYVGEFGAPDQGMAYARRQYDAGAYVIYHAAGGTGYGVIQEAKDRTSAGDVRWVIGVDRDQYADGWIGDRSVMLTSMVKRVDVAAYEVARMTMAGKFPGGQVLVFSVGNGGLGLPDDNPNLSADMVASVKGFADRIASGAIVVSELPASASRN